MDQDLMVRWSALGPIEWGRTDCAALCADELWRATGADPAEDWRAPDGSMIYGADAAVTQGDLLPVMRRAIDRQPFDPVNVADAPALALGLAQLGNWTLGLCLGSGWWVFRADLGAAVVKSELVRRAWIWQPAG